MSENNKPHIAPDPGLLEAVYKTAVTPDSYDALMVKWQQHLEKAVSQLGDGLTDADDPEDRIEISQTLPHLETSFQILEALGRKQSKFAAPEFHGNGKPAFCVGSDGTVVWYNGIAARDLKLKMAMPASALPVSRTAQSLIEDAVRGLAGAPCELRPFIIAFQSASRDRVIHMIATVVTDGSQEPNLAFNEAEARWNDKASIMMKSAFDLSDSEMEITAALVQGHGLKTIAEMRGRTLATIRTQLKSILRKTETRSQSRLVRLCMVLAAHMPASEKTARIGAQSVRFFNLPSKRTMPYHVFGPPDGDPVVFVHGMLDGVQVTDEIQELQEQLNLRIIGPERPFFGSAEGEGVKVKDAITAFSKDTEDLVKHLGLGRFAVAGHMAGVLSAYAIANLLPDQVIAVVPVSGGVPIITPAQLKMMSARQRMVAYTSRYAPSALPFILRAGIRQLDSGGAKKFMDALYVDSQADRQACARSEIFDTVSAGYRHAVAQGHRAFEIDSYHVVRDWSPLVEATSCPIHLIHGRHDPVVRIETVRDFAERYNQRTTLHEHPGQGQLVYYADPGFVLGVIADLFAKDRATGN